MAEQASETNREQVETGALVIFSKEKAQPLIPCEYRSKSGAVTYASIRTALKASNPDLKGDALTERVNQLKNEMDAVTLATVLQLHREGFHFNRMNGRELKNGTRNVSIAMSDGRDRSAKPKKVDLSKLTDEELAAELERRTAATAPTHDV
jgi:hypothetical protein